MVWFPSHCNAAGNEMTDKAAKKAMKSGTVFELLLAAKEVYPIIKSKIRNKWQKEWAGHVKHRHMIDPNLMSRIMQYSENRKLDVIYTRLSLGVNGFKANNIFLAWPTQCVTFARRKSRIWTTIYLTVHNIMKKEKY